MALSLFVGGAMRSVDILTLGMFVAAKEVGSYGALSTIAQLVQAYPSAASQTLGPTVSRYYRDGDMISMRRVMSEYLRSASIVGGFLFGGIAALGDHLDLLFGRSFHFRPDIAFLLPLGWLISATLGPMGFSLSMTGRHRVELGILVMGFATLTIGCAVLVPRLGQVGAASAVVTAFAFINIARFSYLSWTHGFVPGSLSDFVPPLVAYVLGFGVKLVVDSVLGRSLATFLLACAVYAVLNAFVAYRLYLTNSERKTLLLRLTGVFGATKRA
jgi:O-antigen/teichoic acid export membrane protein